VRREGLALVGGTPEQVHKLLELGDPDAPRGLFDLILIDEASQMDVAHAILPLCGLAEGGAVVLAGDDKQLPPIHRADPPLGLEAMVGSIYAFCKAQGVMPVMLDENYRSGATLVEFAHLAGYGPGVRSHSPELRLHLVGPLPTVRPGTWPDGLHWTPEWAELLDPAQPAACFVYE
jgi:superfamily I DNA and/or RNA helicase